MIKNIVSLKATLFSEFNLLISIEDKFVFWETKLELKFPTYCIMMSNYYTDKNSPEFIQIHDHLQEFKITPKTNEEILTYNNLCIDYIKFLDSLSFHKKLYNLEELESKFLEDLKKIKNKNEYIKHKLKNIDDIAKDRLKIAEVLQSIIDKIIITSKDTGDNQNIYYLKIYLKDDALPITGVFYKKERMWYKKYDLQTEIKNFNMKQMMNPTTKFAQTIDLTIKGELIEKIGIDMINYAVAKVPRVYKN